MTEQRLPIVDSDDGAWGDLLNKYLAKEHYDNGVDDVANGGHKTITVQPGTNSAGTAPIKLTSGPLMDTAEVGAIEFNADAYYGTITTGAARKQFAFITDILKLDQTTPQTTVGKFTFPRIQLGAGTATANTAPLKFTSGTLLTTPEAGAIEYLSNQFYIRGNDGLSVAGKVGIGTTAPGAKLEIAGTVTSFEALRLKSSNNLGADRGVFQTFYIPTGTLDTRIGGKILVANQSPDWGSYMAFSTETTLGGGVSEKVRIQSDGNVGIGTTSPNGLLDLQTGNGIALRFGADINATTRTDATRKFGRISMPHYLTAEQDVLLFVTDSQVSETEVNIGGGSVLYNAATKINFITGEDNVTLGGTTRMAIDSLGNVGFGVLSPLANLDIKTSAGFTRGMRIGPQTSTVNDGTYIEFTSSSSDGYGAQIGGIREGASGANALVFRTGDNTQTEKMRITNAGDVGIGTTAPTHSLTLPSTSTGIAIYNTADQTTDTSYLRTYWSGNVAYIRSVNSGTASLRNINIGNANASFVIISGQGTAASGIFNFSRTLTVDNATILAVNGASNNSSGIIKTVLINTNINQTGTAGYTALLINPTETKTGSGAKLLIDAQVGSVSKFQVTNTGAVTIAAGSATAGTAPLKFTSGTLLTTPELGTFEYVDDGTTGHLYFTLNIASVVTRVQIL